MKREGKRDREREREGERGKERERGREIFFSLGINKKNRAFNSLIHPRSSY